MARNHPGQRAEILGTFEHESQKSNTNAKKPQRASKQPLGTQVG